MKMKQPLNKKDLKFMKSWEKQRANRLAYASIHGFILSLVTCIVLYFLNDYDLPKDTKELIITFVIFMIINTLVQYFWNYKVMERKYQNLLKKKAVNDFHQ